MKLLKQISNGWNYCSSQELDTILYLVLGVIAPGLFIIFTLIERY